MVLHDYIKYYRTPKGKKTNYQKRNDHFYNGYQIIKGHVFGIGADFMNHLRIPSASEIAQEQHKAFLAQTKTKVQASLLQQLNNSMFASVNNKVEEVILPLIQNFEMVLDNFRKKQKQAPISAPDDIELQNLYVLFKKIINDITSFSVNNGIAITAELQELNNNIMQLEAKIASGATLRGSLFDSSVLSFQGKSDPNKIYSFIGRLGALSNNIRGVQLLEKGVLQFLKSIPLPVETEATGQLTRKSSSGQAVQLSQDGVFFLNNNITIPIQYQGSIKNVNLKEFFDIAKKRSSTITIFDNELEILQANTIGIQSKYSRYGWIKMGDPVSFSDIFRLNLAEAKALRNLYILAMGEYENEQIIGSFYIKAHHEHYKALFSYCLSKFMDKIIHNNFYMITKQGIQDSATFFAQLFGAGHYFMPRGNINLISNVEKKYAIQINSNI